MKITILEFAPCADSIYHIHRDREEGYVAGDASDVHLKSGAKLRPRLVSTYAGGKATNVARVMDKLLRPEDEVEIELVVFRPDSPEGRYIHDLQTTALKRVQITPVIIRGCARLCVDLTDPATAKDARVEFNISPRAVWEESALEVALDYTSKLTADLLLFAGNPPLIGPEGPMAVGLYAQIIEQASPRVNIISVDAEKETLARCLRQTAEPRVIKINHDEHDWIDRAMWNDFRGTLLVTDARGCRVREGNRDAVEVAGVEVGRLYSTIGAGDAVHAGFTLARWVWGMDAARAARYGQAAAASSVTSPDGTRGVNSESVERFFNQLASDL
jgi:fructose-1-phosphate kinase PfkB-like protein